MYGSILFITSNLWQNRNPLGRLTRKSIFIHDSFKNRFFKTVPAAMLDLALWRKMPAFFRGTGGLNLFLNAP